MKLFDKIFGTYSERQIKAIMPIVNKIESLADKYAKMTEAELRSQTPILKERLSKGETLDDILPDAYALVRETADRVLGKRPFKVQVMGGIILHQGRIAEMKTGEGKTLVATMPAYLNALEGKGVHVVTVNEYLARVGAEEMGRVYEFLGMTTGLVLHDQTREQKKAAYNCDITYGTNNEFGFDYLRDNMVIYKEHITQRGHHFAIVDEVDSILIDEARTPLIISGEGEQSTGLYEMANRLVAKMKPYRIKEITNRDTLDEIDADYIVDEKAETAVLTAEGIKKAEAFFNLENLSDPENSTIAHHINLAIKAHGVKRRDVDYVVKDDKVLIVDAFTGRIMPGRRYSDGLHQAIEAKEGVKIEKENKTVATITFQNYFRLYTKLSGMTGTALTEEMEFREIYGLDVVEIPTNKPMIRIDHNDVVFRSIEGKYKAIIEQIKECNKKGQPVLVGTVSIDKSEELSRRLRMVGIPHVVLNAKYHEKEAEIVAMAGKLGKVTIATNMAGRGTDILLGGNPDFMAKQEMKKIGYSDEVIFLAVGSSLSVSEEVLEARKIYRELFEKFKKEIEPEYKQVVEAGGLFIVGTERHESRRIDNQLRGRSGRQGDPGESRFFISLEDDLMRLFGSDRILGLVDRLGIDPYQPIDAKILSNSIENAQKRLEEDNFSRRKNVLNYDDVMNQQRALIYKQRREVLDGANLSDKIVSMIKQTISIAVHNYLAGDEKENWNFAALRAHFYGYLLNDDDFNYPDGKVPDDITPESVEEYITERALKIYRSKDELFTPEQMREIERVILLRNVDRHWMDHLDIMEDLHDSIRLQAYAQRDPLNEYRIAAADIFDEMVSQIREDTVRQILSVVPTKKEIKREEVAKITHAGFAGDGSKAPAKKAPVKRNAPKVGPNDPCPCGSGLKYKKCCAAREESQK